MARKFKVVDCFCGAGGLALGFEQAGFDVVYSFDIDQASINTYKHNKQHHHGQAFVRDIYKVSKASIEQDLGFSLGEVDVVVGGPPCQGFSVQRRGDNYDSRNNLVLEYVRLLKDIKPRFFVMENVVGILSKRGEMYLQQLREKMGEVGYVIQQKTLLASDFGVPQNRRRVFIIGELVSDGVCKFTYPQAGMTQTQTVRDAIYDLMQKTENDVANHKGDRLSAINLKRIQAIKEGQGRESLPEELQLKCHTRNDGHRHLDTYGRMSWDEPSPTITAHFDSFSRGRFGHPLLDRTITLREGARLQTFPDSFEFLGNKVEVARQIGNAVPPLLARQVAKQVRLCLQDNQ